MSNLIIVSNMDKQLADELYVSLKGIDSDSIYKTKLKKAEYEEALEMDSLVDWNNLLLIQYDRLLSKILSEYPKEIIHLCVDYLKDIIHKSMVLKEENYKHINKSYIVQLLVSLKYRFTKILINNKKLLYVGEPDQTEYFLLYSLSKLGVMVYVFTESVLKKYDEVLLKKGVGSKVDVSYLLDMLLIKEYDLSWNLNKDIPKVFTSVGDLLLKYLRSDLTVSDGKPNFYAFEFLGLEPSLVKYTENVNLVLETYDSLSNPYMYISNGIDKPTFEETSYISELYLRFQSSRSLYEDILYTIFSISKYKESDIKQLAYELKELRNELELNNETQKENYIKTLLCWFYRLVLLLKDSKIPLVYIWGNLNKREIDFVKLLVFLPIDILHFSPNIYHKLDINRIMSITIGENDTTMLEKPTHQVMQHVNTVAYNAERELDSLLYTGSGLFRDKQFKDIQPLVLKTTYDEINIWWNQEAKFRPSFSVVGKTVKVGTIFSELNGVPNREVKSYLSNIRNLIVKDTIFCEELPFIKLKYEDSEFSKFIKQIVYKDEIDFKKLMDSKYYTYNIYSEETQNLIINKTNELLRLNWCIKPPKNLSYKIIEVIFSLPQNIVKIIHSYDFTKTLPKLILYSSNEGVCSLEDTILIMFLKLLGFDILAFAPTGYTLMGQYIDKSLYNDIIIGDYIYDLGDVDLSKVPNSTKKKSLFNWLF